MMEEWPLAAAAVHRNVNRARTSSGGRIRTATIDFLLDPAERLTEQERALMTDMLHGLVGGLADELRVRLPPQLSNDSAADVSELIAGIARAGLLEDERFMALLLKRADATRVSQAADGGTEVLSTLAASTHAQVAAAAMAVALARGRRRGRVRASVELSDLDSEVATQLVHSVAALLARRAHGADEACAAAAAELLGRYDPQQGLDTLEIRLAAALDEAGLIDEELVRSLAARGEAGLLANVLARLAKVPTWDAWGMLVAPAGGRMALLLRLAGQRRPVAAALFLSIGPALSLDDPADEIDRFDALTDVVVEEERRRLQYPLAYRCACDRVSPNG